jgi:hypothetical protein
MDEDFGGTFITIEDENGEQFELELLGEMEYNGQGYKAFLPADTDEDDPDYGMIILRTMFDENGEEIFESVDDDREQEEVYERFMALLFDDEDDEPGYKQ